MSNETITKKHTDYIKEGDGWAISINRKGVDMYKRFVAVCGGKNKAAAKAGIHHNTLYNFEKNWECAPETWEAIFNAMNAA